MAKNIGKNINVTDEASQTIVALTAGVSTVLAAANPDRIFFSVSLDCSVAPPICVFVKLQDANVDNNLVGEVLFRDQSANDSVTQMRWEMPIDNIFIGEICAITSASDVDIYVTEY